MLGQKSSRKMGLQTSEFKVSRDEPMSSVTISLFLRRSLSPNPGHANESKRMPHVACLPLAVLNLGRCLSLSRFGSCNLDGFLLCAF